VSHSDCKTVRLMPDHLLVSALDEAATKLLQDLDSWKGSFTSTKEQFDICTNANDAKIVSILNLAKGHFKNIQKSTEVSMGMGRIQRVCKELTRSARNQNTLVYPERYREGGGCSITSANSF
jgi:hypothetical protein